MSSHPEDHNIVNNLFKYGRQPLLTDNQTWFVNSLSSMFGDLGACLTAISRSQNVFTSQAVWCNDKHPIRFVQWSITGYSRMPRE